MKNNSILYRILHSYYNIFIVFIIIFIIGMLSQPIFCTPRNLTNVMRQTSVLLIIAVGQNIVILTGGIDLSVGAIISLVSVVVVNLMPITGAPFSMLLGILVGLIAGAINGFVISKFKILPFLITFCAQIIYKGLALFINKGAYKNLTDLSYIKYFSAYIYDIPIVVFYSVVIFLVGCLFLSRTLFGIKIYSVGGNEEAARLSGINPSLTRIKAYAISGMLAAIASLILSGILRVGHALIGDGYELDSIASVCIGGTSLVGGEGSLIGTLGGALITGVLKNLFNLHGTSPYFQQIAMGAIILIAILITKKKS